MVRWVDDPILSGQSHVTIQACGWGCGHFHLDDWIIHEMGPASGVRFLPTNSTGWMDWILPSGRPHVVFGCVTWYDFIVVKLILCSNYVMIKFWLCLDLFLILKIAACSTVLLPARVVQALNLNLDEMDTGQPRFQGGNLILEKGKCFSFFLVLHSHMGLSNYCPFIFSIEKPHKWNFIIW